MLRVALAQIDLTVGALEENAALITRWLNRARAAGAHLVVFPELAISGYPPEDLLLKDHFLAECRAMLDRVAAACVDLCAVVGVPTLEEGRVYNTAAVLSDGKVAGLYHKLRLPNYGVFDEKRYFTPGDTVVVLELGEWRVGVNICEDIWEPLGPSEMAAWAGGARAVVNLSMSPYHLGKGRERENMLAERARAAGAYVCYVNGVGGQDELVFDGHSLVYDPQGGLLARAAQFGEELLVADLEGPAQAEPAQEAERERAQDRHPETPVFAWQLQVLPLAGPRPGTVAGGGRDWPEGGDSVRGLSSDGRRPAVCECLEPEAEVYEALCLGVRDYVVKNGFEQVVMGISGGIDSALTACIAADALGKDRVNAVSMPSRYSSAGTRNDARETAARLGVRYHEIPIEGVYGSYLACLADYLDPDKPGVTEQNIQARIRGNLLMALSNRFGWLVLTTGNKSETAVGYATLYGDMAGGFAVLKDVPKTLVYRLAAYRNARAEGMPPIPESTIQRAPSAELAAGQTDQDTLPPYDLLDEIIEAYVVRDESLEEIVARGLDRATVQRVIAMIDGNEYKRRQAAPGVRITPKAFGKDRRLPITNRYRG